MEKNHLLPASILLAGAMIGAGLFFGLRGRPVESPISPTTPPSEHTPAKASSPLDPKPTPTPVDAVAPEPFALQAKVQKQALDALGKHRAQIVADCWNPSAKKDPNPAKLTFNFRFLFKPTGELGTSSVGDAPAESRRDVSQCIRDLKLPIAVAPPGSEIAVQIPFTLP